jgi:hypothetical protein
MKRLATAALALSLALASFAPALAQEPPEGEPPTLVPGPVTLMWGYIPCCGICAPVCMYTDRLLFDCTGTVTGGSVWGEEGISGILASCVGYGATGVWDWLGPWCLFGPCAPCMVGPGVLCCGGGFGNGGIGGFGIAGCIDRCTEFSAAGLDLILGWMPTNVSVFIKDPIKMVGDACSVCCGG